MSLQVWLPLNGNLNNQGLLGNLTQTTAPTYVNGKLGKCMTTGGLKMTAAQTSQVLNNTAVSICFWVYVDAATGTTDGRALLFGTGSMGANDNRKFSLFSYPTVNDLHWSWMNDAADTTFAVGVIDDALPSYKWTHVAVTYQNPTGKIYINGDLKTTFTGTSNSSTFAYDTTVLHNAPYLRRNDFRIYDHCLSPFEVKEISKGLVCHYKLSGPGGYNLVKDSMVNLTNTEYMIKSFSLSEALVAGNKYSITIKSDIGTRYWIGMWLDVGNVECGMSHPDENGIVKITFTCPTANNYSVVYIHSGTTKGVMGSNGETVTLNYIKIEKGSLFTPWCPNSADVAYKTLGYNDNTEYDCSGFGNHATKTGTINWSNDSRRYSGSYIPANASSYLSTTLTTSGYANSYTIAYWAKISDMNNKMAFGFGDGNRLNLYPTGSVICWNTGDGANNPFKNNGTSISYTSYNGGWHHYAITGNGTTSTLYIDGVRVGDATTYKGITGTKLFISGWDTGTSYKWAGGNISDFRIYATPLSAQDIKSLYQTAASISKSGVMAAYEFVEE